MLSSMVSGTLYIVSTILTILVIEEKAFGTTGKTIMEYDNNPKFIYSKNYLGVYSIDLALGLCLASLYLPNRRQ
ncbi:hypothetical protein F4814DRAFT_419888 [Daldinia grandis]|nr:hypothetical protein F4814DRAFT_419888 [Daldinia grandis]